MFIGRDGFYWWIGTVEDNDDPLILGRAKVRIFGYHPPYRATEGVDVNNTIPSVDLPWATVVLSPNSSGQYSRLGLGEWVFGFFLDGPEAQEPAIIGYLPTELAEGAVPAAQSFSKHPTTKRTFSNITQQTTPYSVASLDFQKLSRRKSFFSESGHHLEFLDHPEINRIDLRHNNNKTALTVGAADVYITGNSGTYGLSEAIKNLSDRANALNTSITTLGGQLSGLAGTASLSPYGYQKLPSGLLMQWGKVAVGSYGGGATITFPISFSQVFSVQTTPVAPGALSGWGNKRDSFNIYGVTASQFVLYSIFETGRGGIPYGTIEYYWFAVGV